MIDIQQLAFRTGYALSRSGSEQHLSVLVFHRVMPDSDPMRPNETTQADFDWQMGLLKRHFNPLPLSRAVELLRNEDLPPRAVCVTFDDGYADNATTALPILQRHQIPATIFVATGFLDGGRMWNDTVLEALRKLDGREIDLAEFGLGVFTVAEQGDRLSVAREIIGQIKYLDTTVRSEIAEYIASLAGPLPEDLMMTTDQLKKVHHRGMDIGGHTISHPILSSLSLDEARDEIQGGRDALGDILGKPPGLFAYPNGRRQKDFSQEHLELVKEAGFDAAVITNRGVAGPRTDPYQLPRFTPWDKSTIRYLVRMIWNARNITQY